MISNLFLPLHNWFSTSKGNRVTHKIEQRDRYEQTKEGKGQMGGNHTFYYLLNSEGPWADKEKLEPPD